MNSNKKIKLIGAILGVVLFIAVIAGITYAVYTWQSENINISGTSECFTINYTNGPTILGENVALFDEDYIIYDNQITIKDGMVLTSVSASIDSSCSITGKLDINLTMLTKMIESYTVGTSAGAFKYVIANYDPSAYPTVSVEELQGISFDIIKTGSITSDMYMNLYTDELSTTTKGYLIIFYIDGDMAFDYIQDSSLRAMLSVIATQTE